MLWDGKAVLRCWPMQVTVAGRAYRLGPRPALDWLDPLLRQDWLAIVPGWADEAEALDDLLFDGGATSGELTAAARDATTLAAGVPWWVAVRLMSLIVEQPVLLAPVSRLDWTTAPLGQVLVTAYEVWTRHADRKRREQFDSTLQQPPAEVTAADRYDPQVAADLFEQAFSARS